MVRVAAGHCLGSEGASSGHGCSKRLQPGFGPAAGLQFKTDMQGWTGTGVPGKGTGLDRGPRRWVGLLVGAGHHVSATGARGCKCS